MSVVDMALDREVLKRKGSWIAYKGETLAQGKESVATYIAEHPDLMEEIKAEVLRKVAEGLGIINEPSPNDESEAPGIEDSVEALLEEGALKLDISKEEDAE